MLGEEVSGPHASSVCSTELMWFHLPSKSEMGEKEGQKDRGSRKGQEETKERKS